MALHGATDGAAWPMDLFLTTSRWLRQGTWQQAKLAAIPLGVSCRGPRRKVVRRVEQEMLGLSATRLYAHADAILKIERQWTGAE